MGQTANIMLCNATGNTCTPYTTVAAAFTAANTGDIIYLPAGGFALPDLNKEITIIGVGANVDSCTAYGGRTTIGGNINLKTNNITLEGLNVTGQIINNSGGDISNIKVKYCKFQDFYGTPNPANSACKINNSYIIGCYCVASIQFGYAAGIGNGPHQNNCGSGNFVLNTLMVNLYHSEGGTINNCVFNASCVADRIFNNTISNCIFMGHLNWNNGVYYIWPGVYFGGNDLINCYGNGATVPVNNGWAALTNFTAFTINNSLYPFNPSTPINVIPFPVRDFADIPAGHPAKTAATDGGEVGINGGLYPWHTANGGHGCVPSNPHIYFKSIAPTTDANGNLPVIIKVRTGSN
jgi:hypothetical protein